MLSSAAAHAQHCEASSKPPTVVAFAANFQSEVDAAFAPIVGTVGYIDTVCVLVPGRHSKAVTAYLEQAGCTFHPGETKAWHWGVRYQLSQPSEEALKGLIAILPRYCVSRVDVSLDFICREKSEAVALQDFVVPRITQRWPSKASQVACETTIYLRRAWQRRNALIYSDKSSKVDGRPCVHVEMRFTRAADCRRLGLNTFEGILACSPQRIAEHELRLCSVNPRQLAAAINRYARRAAQNMLSLKEWHYRSEPRRKALAILAHGVASENESAMALNWDDVTPHEWRTKFPSVVASAMAYARLPFSGSSIANAVFNAPPGPHLEV